MIFTNIIYTIFVYNVVLKYRLFVYKLVTPQGQ